MESILPEKESEATAALRAELEQELKNKKQCSYSSYDCTQLSLDGYKYCSRHILQDKNAPFKQCTYTYGNNGKRCNLPAPRSDKKEYGYCSEHTLKATLTRNKQNSKFPPPNTAEVLLNSLSHYIKKPRIRNVYSGIEDGDKIIDDIAELKVTRSNDPFVDLDASSIYNDHCNAVMDYCSDSESDIEPSTFSTVWHDYQADSSENESVDSDGEDPLKHANVYTAEEITLITKEKLMRLQTLYIEQYRHLQYLLREKRRKYLHSLKREKETCCNIYNQVRDNPKEQRLYKKLKALNNYHRYHGQDRILNKRFRDLRNKMTDGSSQKVHAFTKCTFSEGGVKCVEKVMPLAKHCRKHILEDLNQVLFKSCGKMTGDVQCTTPIAAIFDDATCPLHMEIPPLKSYNQTRKDSESDMEDSAEAHLQHFAQFSESVKHEFLDYNPPEIPKMETVPSLLFEENSQSMSESTMSQSGLFDSNFENAPSDNSQHMKYEKIIENTQTADQEPLIKTELMSQIDDSSHESGYFQGFENQNLNESQIKTNQVLNKLEAKYNEMIESQSEIIRETASSIIHDSNKVIEQEMLLESEQQQSLTVEESDSLIKSQTETLDESYDNSLNQSGSKPIITNQPTIASETEDQTLNESDETSSFHLNLSDESVKQNESAQQLENNSVQESNIFPNIGETPEVKTEIEEVIMNEIYPEESVEEQTEMVQEEMCMEVVKDETEMNAVKNEDAEKVEDEMEVTEEVEQQVTVEVEEKSIQSN